MDNTFSSLIEPASSILIILPIKPYLDQVAAALGLYLSLGDKKEVAVYCSTPMTVGFNRLVGVDKIKNETGNKNLEIRFADYDATSIEKVSYDIENGEFRLKVVPKVGLSSPQKDQVVTSYSGVSTDLAILIGGANDSHFPLLATKELAGVNILHIGTRALLTPEERRIMSFARPASSTSEIVAGLIKDNNLSMDVDVATNLVVGVEEGSGRFESSEVTPETFETFAYLLKSGGRRSLNQKLSPSAFPQGSIPQKPFSAKTVRPSQPEEKEETVEQAPKDWLEPKIFKGTSVG